MARAYRGTLAGAAVMAAFLHHYYYLLLNPSVRDRALIARYQHIAEGSDMAPDQYRLLIPKVAAAIVGTTSLALPVVIITIDSVSLIGGGLVLADMLRRQGRSAQILPVLLYVTACASTVLLYPRPETLPAFLGVSCILAAYLDSARRTVILGAFGALLLAGCRPEMVITAAIPFALKWWEDRRTAHLAASAALLTLGTAGALMPILLYPNAHYLTDVIQIGHNLNPRNQLVPLFVFAPLLAYLTSARLRQWKPLLAWVGSVIALTFVVGRLPEARIYFPMSGVVGFVAAHFWAESQNVDDNARISR